MKTPIFSIGKMPALGLDRSPERAARRLRKAPAYQKSSDAPLADRRGNRALNAAGFEVYFSEGGGPPKKS